MSGNLLENHKRLRAINGRGTETPSHLAAIAYLRGLEDEMRRVNDLLLDAWKEIDSKDFRKCAALADRAQQKLHRVIKRMAKGKKPR